MKITFIVLVLLLAQTYCDIPPNDCPDNFEFINGQCFQCKPGYQSGGGYPCMKCSAGTFFIKPNYCGQCGQGFTSLYGGFCFKCPEEAKIDLNMVCQCPTNYCLTNINSSPECTLCSPQNSQSNNNNNNNNNNSQNSNNANSNNLCKQDTKTFSSILTLGMLIFTLIIF
ncbi:hypothetical protein TTHERM_000112309 (macronuclear) [Tetrahymena thermophila SB210]|uniref:Uncharacterized protein n=1 Tax=Tetrahymena thermophila (strain SB210) TaxID=312017 RepID=W7XFW0_TETTS|nr:hypothetical protein TTHERM_000112309 [Tetrahymena thermophila SB210]EWS75763.1 hypothetical protein TTHERM_000112309 [Tetrahymena thermophila SB210]|eukprot:XP_012651685.1 hypothetical protein TTHERM_000112309 [Tetrahymena thermophila SB210]